MLFTGLVLVIIAALAYFLWNHTPGTRLFFYLPTSIIAGLTLGVVFAGICNNSVLAYPVERVNSSQSMQAIEKAESRNSAPAEDGTVHKVIKITLASGVVYTFVEGVETVENSDQNMLVTETTEWQNLLFSPFVVEESNQIFYAHVTEVVLEEAPKPKLTDYSD